MMSQRIISGVVVAAVTSLLSTACGEGKSEPSAPTSPTSVSTSSGSVASASVGGSAGPAVGAAAAIEWTGQGTTNGLCNNLQTDPNVTGQIWLFILTQPGPGTWSLTTTFSPGTQTPSNPIIGTQQAGGSVHFSVTTTIGATLLSASATSSVDGAPGGNLVVSHCTVPSQTALQVSKTATTSFTRDFDWTISKTASQSQLTLAAGSQATVNYQVVATRNGGADSKWSVSGTITVKNPHPSNAATGVTVADNISGVGAVAVKCPSTTIAAGATMECTYGPVALPDGSARTNTAAATTSASGFTGGSGTASVTFGAPTTLADNCVTVTDSQTGSLGNICATQTFSYSRTVSSSTTPCGNSTLTNIATLSSDDGTTKQATANIQVTNNCPVSQGVQGCSPGFWKQTQHFDSWTSVSPNTPFATVFGRTITVGAGGRDTVANPTLLQALSATGGGASQIARIGTAAYLSAVDPNVNYPYSPAQVIQAVQQALDGTTGSIAIADLEKAWEEGGQCPLS
jgi:hypothetical protein